jgi:hypothetical protein
MVVLAMNPPVHAFVYLNIQENFAKLVNKYKIKKELLFKYFYKGIGCQLNGSLACLNGGVCQNSSCICPPSFRGITCGIYEPTTKKTTAITKTTITTKTTTTKTTIRIWSTTTTRSTSRSTTTKTTTKEPSCYLIFFFYLFCF